MAQPPNDTAPAPGLSLRARREHTSQDDVCREYGLDGGRGRSSGAVPRSADAIDPSRRASAGFVAGYTTLVPNGGTAYEFTVFDSELAARAYMRRVGQDQPGQVQYGVQ